ncbi:hypothetical protein D3C81_827710 [compost metagenome]
MQRAKRQHELGCGYILYSWDGDNLARESSSPQDDGETGRTVHYLYERVWVLQRYEEKAKNPMMHDNKEAGPIPEQAKVCKRYDVSPRAPEDRVAIALGTLKDNPIYGVRVKLPEDGTVSWFFYCGEYSDAEDFYQVIHTRHLQEELPEVMNYLYLPEGSKFIIDREGYEDVWFEA